MNENAQQPREKKQEPPKMLSEMKTLGWLSIISVWITLFFVLYMGAKMHQTSLGIHDISTKQDNSGKILQRIDEIESNHAAQADRFETLLADEMNRLDKTLADEMKSVTRSINDVVAEHHIILNQIKSDLLTRTSEMNDIMEERAKQQKKEAKHLQRKTNKMNQAVNQRLDRLIQEQKVLLTEIRNNRNQNIEKMRLFKKYIENQTQMLNQMGEILVPAKP